MSNSKDECTHSREHRVHSMSHRADEIDTSHSPTCTPSHLFSFPTPLPVVLTHMLPPLGPIWLQLVVLSRVLARLAPLLQWLVVLSRVLALLAPLLQWLVVLSRVLVTGSRKAAINTTLLPKTRCQIRKMNVPTVVNTGFIP